MRERKWNIGKKVIVYTLTFKKLKGRNANDKKNRKRMIKKKESTTRM